MLWKFLLWKSSCKVNEFVVKMKINNCKLCETYDNQKLSGDKGINAQPQFCRHTSAAAAFLSPNHIRDFLAFHLLRGNY